MSRWRWSLILLLASVAAAPLLAWAAPQGASPPERAIPVASAPPRQLAAGDVDVARSRVYAFVGKTGLGHEHAIAGSLAEGRWLIGAEQDAGRLTFDLRRFTADEPAARRFLRLEGTTAEGTRRQVTENMLGPDVLDVARYPTATCVFQSIRATGQTSRRGLPWVECTGQFTLHGTTRPVNFVAEVETLDGWQRVMGSFKILQTDYGIQPLKKAFGAIGVANELTIYGDLWVASRAMEAARPAEPTAALR